MGIPELALDFLSKNDHDRHLVEINQKKKKPKNQK